MSKIDEIKVKVYDNAKALLESKLNQKASIQKDLDAVDAEIVALNEEITAMSSGFKSAIEASVALKEDTVEVK